MARAVQSPRGVYLCAKMAYASYDTVVLALIRVSYPDLARCARYLAYKRCMGRFVFQTYVVSKAHQFLEMFRTCLRTYTCAETYQTTPRLLQNGNKSKGMNGAHKQAWTVCSYLVHGFEEYYKRRKNCAPVYIIFLFFLMNVSGLSLSIFLATFRAALIT